MNDEEERQGLPSSAHREMRVVLIGCGFTNRQHYLTTGRFAPAVRKIVGRDGARPSNDLLTEGHVIPSLNELMMEDRGISSLLLTVGGPRAVVAADDKGLSIGKTADSMI